MDSKGTVNFIYDGAGVLMETNRSGQILGAYTNGLMGTISKRNAQNEYGYLMKDALGTTRNIVDADEVIKMTYKYDIFGAIREAIGSDPIGIPKTFTGKELDTDSGLHYFGARYYDSAIGRFITADSWTWGPDDERAKVRSHKRWGKMPKCQAPSPNPVDSFRIEFDATAVDSSGGHWHDGDRLAGYPNPDTGLTDQNGHLATTYTAPACTCGRAEGCNQDSLFRGIAGEYIVRAISRDDTTLWDSLHIECGLFSLAELEDGDHWALSGSTGTHPFNHYGTVASNQDLREIGTEFDSTMTARAHPGFDEGTVTYNDQSLEWGGLFDKDADWLCPHCAHYHGWNCDIGKFGVPVFDSVLGRIIEEHGDTLGYYRSHWHARFPE